MCGSSVQWASRPRRGLALAPTWRKQPVQGVYRWPNEVAQPGWGCADWLGRGLPALRHLAAQVVHAYCVVVHRVQGAWAGLPRPESGQGRLSARPPARSPEASPGAAAGHARLRQRSRGPWGPQSPPHRASFWAASTRRQTPATSLCFREARCSS